MKTYLFLAAPLALSGFVFAQELQAPKPVPKPGRTPVGATSEDGVNATAIPFNCTRRISDQAGGCMEASSTPTLGMLYPMSTNLFVNPTTGNVGMETTNPSEKLQIGEFFTTTDDAFIEMRTVGGGTPLSQGLKMRSSNPFFGFDIAHDDGSKGLDIRRWDIDFGSFGSSALFVDRETGNVGLNTTSPTDQLQLGTNSTPGDRYMSVRTSGGNIYKAGLKLYHFSDDNGFTIESDESGPVNGLNISYQAGGPATSALYISRVNGNVGIATVTPGFNFEVNGSAGKPGGGSWSVSSDARLKKNVEDLDDALETLLALRGVSYEYKDPEAIGELAGERLGFIAQEVEQVIPDWVGEKADGYKHLTIRGFEALAVEALRELSADNDELRAALEAKDAEMAELKGAMLQFSSLAGKVAELEAQLSALQPR